ncbi:MAG: hypothetical protein ABI290_09720 [Ginsengibacter sp.]
MSKVTKIKEEEIANTGIHQKTIAFTKKKKKRLLPDVFYLRWEAELLSALVAILILILLPDWLNDKVNLFLSGYDTSVDTNWISVACNILLAFFLLYVIFRLAWLFFIRKEDNVTPRNIHLAITTDHLAEIIFSLCIIILVLILLISMVELLSIILKNVTVEKMKNIQGAGQ